MSETHLEPYYRQAREFAREMVTLIKYGEQNGVDLPTSRREVGTQIRQQIQEWESEASPMRTWLLIETLARAVADTYDDLADWSTHVLEALADEGVQ